jgi:hypothetical protein
MLVDRFKFLDEKDRKAYIRHIEMCLKGAVIEKEMHKKKTAELRQKITRYKKALLMVTQLEMDL